MSWGLQWPSSQPRKDLSCPHFRFPGDIGHLLESTSRSLYPQKLAYVTPDIATHQRQQLYRG